MNKLPDFHTVLDVESPDIVVINETYLAEHIFDAEVISSPYVVFRRDRNRNGGGVMVAARDSLKPTRAPEFEHDNLELLWTKITCR